ncbi:MAG: PDDEXK nuclease domain-containing protein [Bacteroidota bacterium]
MSDALSPKDPLIVEIRRMVEEAQNTVARTVTAGLTILYWRVGQRINEEIIEDERAEYGKQVVLSLSKDLVENYGRSFEPRNLRRMMQFAEVFADFKIVSTLSTQLSWSHFVELLPIDNQDKRLFYAQRIAEEGWSVRQTRKQIERKAFERTQVGNVQLPQSDNRALDTFKDPYFLDFLGLKDGYLENDLESAILKEMEGFILELGSGFTFVERQKRMIIDGKDFYLDLLFFHRKLKRLVAIELKIGQFKAEHKGQMELYLKWLNKYDRQEGEEAPIGLILCAESSSEQVELLEMHKDGIMVAEYWTELPSKTLLETKVHQAMIRAKNTLSSE